MSKIIWKRPLRAMKIKKGELPPYDGIHFFVDDFNHPDVAATIAGTSLPPSVPCVDGILGFSKESCTRAFKQPGPYILVYQVSEEDRNEWGEVSL